VWGLTAPRGFESRSLRHKASVYAGLQPDCRPTPILTLDHEDGSDLLPMLHGLDRVEASARLRRLGGIPPRFLYKFGRPDGKATKGILEASEFFLSPPSAFNDPFDSRARVVWEGTEDDLFNQTYFTALRHGKSYEQAQAIATAMAAAAPPDLQAAYDESANQFGITCFVRSSQPPEPRAHAAHSLLMWAHYADEHRGFCFQFHAPQSAAVFGAAVPITYDDTLLTINWAARDKVSELLGKALLRKSNDWTYEHERRIARPGDAGKTIRYRPRALTGVIVGLRAKAADIDRLISMCRVRKKAFGVTPLLYRAAVVPGHYQICVARAPDLDARVHAP
jgi:hypothetical protein